MNNTGNPEVEAVRGRVPWRLLVLLALAVVLAVIIGTQVLGVLYAIVFPPTPPLPGDTQLVSHQNKDYGVDEWLYSASQEACSVVIFYQDKGITCEVAPGQCGTRSGTGFDLGTEVGGQSIARCASESKFSIFAQRVEVFIGAGFPPDGRTQFRLKREVFWTGTVPPRPTATP